MLTSIARHSPAIIAGSALTGFGLAFGRDVYRKAKDKWLWLLILLLCLIGVFFAGIWLFRNYRTVWGTLFKKPGALIVPTASCAGVNLTAAITIGLVAPDALRVDDLAPHWAAVSRVRSRRIDGCSTSSRDGSRRRIAARTDARLLRAGTQ